jgi:pyruvate dehydrogenase E1 component alpha subunit
VAGPASLISVMAPANQGQVYEASTMASLWVLRSLRHREQPICDGHLGRALRHPSPCSTSGAESFRIPGIQVDGMDVPGLARRGGRGDGLDPMRARGRSSSSSDLSLSRHTCPTRQVRTREEVQDYREKSRPDRPCRKELEEMGVARTS